MSLSPALAAKQAAYAARPYAVRMNRKYSASTQRFNHLIDAIEYVNDQAWNEADTVGTMQDFYWALNGLSHKAMG